MAKLAIVLFLAALAFQASVAVPMHYEEGHLVNYLDEIKNEVRDLTVFFEKDFPEHYLAIETVHWQWNRLVQVLQVIINKLHEETMMVHGEHKVFKDVIYTLQELVDAFQKVTMHRDITSVHDLRKYFVLTIHTVLEHFDRLVTITNTYYPEFRYTLKYLLVDFMTALHGIRNHFVHINSGFKVVQTSKQLVKEIREYTREFTDTFKEFNHQAQVNVALRRYVYYVDEIVHRLQDQDISGHKELDVVIHRLTNKLREIVFPLKEITHDNIVDVSIFRTKIIGDYYDVASIFEQLVQLYEDKVLPEELSRFLTNVIYHYWYAVRHVSYEVKLGYRIGFYSPEYYNTEYYARYGYGLYERDFHRFYTPYYHENHMHHYPVYMRNYHHDDFTPYRYESLFPVQRVYGQTYNWNRYGSNYYNRYYQNVRYNYESETHHHEVVRTIQMLVNQVYEQYRYNPVQVGPMVLYHIREFIQFLDYFFQQYETRVHFEHSYTDKHFEEFIYRMKEVRNQLREMANVGIFTNANEIRMHFVHSIESVAMDLSRWFERYGYEQVYSKEIVHKFIGYLQNITHQHHYNYDHEYVPVSGYSRYVQHFNRYLPNYWLKY